MSTNPEPVATVAACDQTVIVARPDQAPMVTSRDAWRQLLADIRAGRWDRPSR